MNSLTLLSPAKINLTLEVLRRREDGYHEIRSIVQPIDLFDEVRLEPARGEDIELSASGMEVPSGEDNLAWKAAALYFKESGVDAGVKIELRKKIPAGSGLGGGSGNAAAVLTGLNKMYGAFTDDELIQMSPVLGADVPLFIRPMTALVEGIGEKLTPLRGFPLFYYVILCPNVNVSTAMVYRKWDELHEGKGGEAREDADIGKTIETFKNLEEGFSLRNDLEAPADELYPEIKAFREILSSLDAKDVRMTGSGGAVFAVFKDEAKAQVLYEYLKTSPTFRVFMVKGIKGRHRLI
ncbi:MAG TPA: 4-(cytidine 5'-diphospho)-2-C-methyl-D-erythritol kinase [Thermodesulfobacteriota bacterium]|nr:4-(cytidine 5'-diphospho)-2-C-methyl-D-erythritol kinase [Thermodesulfobacteriota bacterium]